MTRVWVSDFGVAAIEAKGSLARVFAAVVEQWAEEAGYATGMAAHPDTGGDEVYVEAPSRELLLTEWRVAGCPGMWEELPF